VLQLRRYEGNRLKIGVVQGVVSIRQILHLEGDVPTNHFRTDR